ncbi:MAG: helix-turn-helix transcriptional regulator [Lachnospiraceae bacterium]|jgi:transcriptional regulator with XRE-family HTH domain|nr:helix-turn-helix transcriptional regulator [Lachnospiraceae bacterium]
MNIAIAENLRAFRRERGNTQEELSSHLGISTQAVSKWERGEGYPDITLLPRIAGYYEKSVDELLGCGEIERNRIREEQKERFFDKCREGKIEDAIILMRQALRESPKHLPFMWYLAWAMRFTRKEEYVDERIELCKRILETCVDDEMRYLTLDVIIDAYGIKKNVDKAKEYADKLPPITCTKGIVLGRMLRGEEGVKQSQENIITLVNIIDNSVTWMLRSGEYTAEERIFAYETVDKLYNLFLYDGNYGREHNALHLLWTNIAKGYAELGEEEKTIEALKKAGQHAFAAEHLEESGDGRYTSLFADRGSYFGRKAVRSNEGGPVSWLRKEMEGEVFNFVRETEAFRDIGKTREIGDNE